MTIRSGFAPIGNARLSYEMNRTALAHEAKHLGTRVPEASSPAVNHLDQLSVPVLVIVGAHDTPYILAAADYMVETIGTASKVVIDDAAHLPNMDQPGEFQRIVGGFLDGLPAIR